MFTLIPILARKSEDEWIKFLFGAVVVAIWIIGAIVSAINKQIEQARRRQRTAKLPPDVGVQQSAAPFFPPAPGSRAPSGPAAPPPLPARKGKRKGHKQQVFAAPPEPARPAASLVQPAPAPVAPAAAAPVAASSASRIARLAHRHDTLRAAFILGQVWGPPVALRDPMQEM